MFDRIEPINRTFRLEKLTAYLISTVIDIMAGYFGKRRGNTPTDPSKFIDWLQKDVEVSKEELYNEKLKTMSERERADSIEARIEKMFGGFGEEISDA